jgi:hypothetical protein
MYSAPESSENPACHLLAQPLRQMNPKHPCNSSHHSQVRVAFPSLYSGDMGPVNFGIECKLFLRQFLLLT